MPELLNQGPASCKDGAQCKQTDRVVKAPLHMQTIALFANPVSTWALSYQGGDRYTSETDAG